MRKNLLILFFCFLFIFTVAGVDTRQTFRDNTGKIIGTAQQNGGTTYYRDAAGRTAVTARQNGSTTTYRDNTGKIVGTARQTGNTTTCRDAAGRTIGTTWSSNITIPGKTTAKP